MISSNDLRNGISIKVDNGVWFVIEFLHVKPGKGSAFVRTKLKNAETGQVVEKTFRAGEKVEKAMLSRREMQYLYAAGEDEFIFMDNESFDQISLTKAQLGDGVKYLKENTIVNILKHEDKLLGIDLPNNVELEVVETPPAEKGNTAQGGTKPATLETGAVVNVPFFINVGDVLRIDTRTNEYLDRV